MSYNGSLTMAQGDTGPVHGTVETFVEVGAISLSAAVLVLIFLGSDQRQRMGEKGLMSTCDT